MLSLLRRAVPARVCSQAPSSALGYLGAQPRALSPCTPNRCLSSKSEGDGVASPSKAAATSENNPGIPMCQLNNHPDFRLQQAKAKLALQSVQNTNVTAHISENPVRSSDGTSSGARAEDRLRMARRKVLENMSKVPLTQRPTKRRGRKFHKVVKEHGLAISVRENPVVSNDGTSSGALAADRLRMARRKAMESMMRTVPEETSEHNLAEESEDAFAAALRQAGGSTEEKLALLERLKKQILEDSGEELPQSKPRGVKEHGLGVNVTENPRRSSDGISSGAKAADRLRMARRRALESMNKHAE